MTDLTGQFDLYRVDNVRPEAVAAQVAAITQRMPAIDLPSGSVLILAIVNTLLLGPDRKALAVFLRSLNEVIATLPDDFRDQLLDGLEAGIVGAPAYVGRCHV